MSSFAERFALNAESALKSGSTWAGGLIVLFGGFWLAMSPEQQKAIVDGLPFLKGYGLILTPAAIWLTTRFKPSNAVSPQTKALVEEVLRLRTNESLRAHGVPEIPPPAGGVPLPAGTIVAPIPAPPPAPAPPPPPPPPPDPALEQLRAIEPAATDDGLALALKVLRTNRSSTHFDPTVLR